LGVRLAETIAKRWVTGKCTMYIYELKLVDQVMKGLETLKSLLSNDTLLVVLILGSSMYRYI
jgi:hypothetical protein